MAVNGVPGSSTSSVSIFARDRVGNLRVNGGHEWRVVIEPRGDDEASDLKAAAEEATASAAITDAKDGRYHVGFVVPRAGRYFVHVTLLEKKREGGEASEEQEEEPRQQYPLPGSPFAPCRMKPTPTSFPSRRRWHARFGSGGDDEWS